MAYRYRVRHLVLLLISLYLLAFAYLVPALCSTWPYSFYFRVNSNAPEDKNHSDIVRRIFDDNRRRTQSSEAYLTNLHSSQIRQFNIDADNVETQLELSIGIITIKRTVPVNISLKYLTQTTATLLSVLTHQQQRDTKLENTNIFLCNVDAKPLEHDEAIRMSKYVSYVARYNDVSYVARYNDSRIKQASTSVQMNKFEKEKDDYVFCMKKAAKTKPKYVLLLQDDVLLEEHAIMAINHLLKSRIKVTERPLSSVDMSQKWFQIKLFYPERWTGYALEIDKLSELVGLGLIGGSLFTFVHILLLRMFHPLRKRAGLTKRRRNTSILVFCLGAATLVIAAVLIGRPYMRSWRGFSIYTHRLIPAPDCCMPAVLYPTEIISDLTLYLLNVSCNEDFPVDLAIGQFSKLYKMTGFLIEPNVARHIGFFSTLSYKDAVDFLY